LDRLVGQIIPIVIHLPSFSLNSLYINVVCHFTMKICTSIWGLFLLFSLTTQAQEIEHLDKKWYADRIRTRATDLRSYQIDAKRDYKIMDEGAEYSEDGQHSITKADLIVNEDSLTTIINTEAFKRGDTLDILLYNEIDASHDHNFQIQIIRDKCFVFYDFSYPMDEENRKLNTIKFQVTLDKNTFSVGAKLRGHVEYIGKCTSYCIYDLKDVEVHGDFVVTIK
jgi:hypothetical protein